VRPAARCRVAGGERRNGIVNTHGLAENVSGAGEGTKTTVSAEVKSNRLALAWDGLRLSVPVGPNRTANLQRQVQWGTLRAD
jgi:hypothetical protein